MLMVTLSIALLAVGPLLSHWLHRRRQWLLWLDRLTFALIAAVLFAHVLPESIEHAGWLALLMLALGFGLPTLAEKALHKAAETVHLATLGLGMLGLSAHAMLDGLSLTDGVYALSHGSLPALVLLHRIPVGQLIWTLLRPGFGKGISLAVLGMVAIATVAGFALGHSFAHLLHGIYFSLFQALVAGAILHVVVFRGHVHQHHSHKCG